MTVTGDEADHHPTRATDREDAGREDPGRLLADYRRGDFFLSTSERTILGRGAETAVTAHDLGELDQRVSDVLSTAAAPLALGVVPFAAGAGSKPGQAPTVPARLVVPTEVWRAGAAHAAARHQARQRLASPVRVRPLPEHAAHRAAVDHVLDRVGQGTLSKVVLARALDLTFDYQLDPAWLLRNLVRDHPDGYTFAAELPGTSYARTLVGASPELLLRRTGTHVVSQPHAGSAPRSDDPATDKHNAKTLLASAKEHAEHSMVTEAVVDALRPFCRSIDVPAAPSLTSTSTMWHLGTTITGELYDTDASALRLASALHPTPAVCGTPTTGAYALLDGLEPFSRDYYAGAVGWMDAHGDGEWAVAIRCAEVTERSMRLYSGGGIVDGSDPDAELAETSAKFRTLLRAMGLQLQS